MRWPWSRKGPENPATLELPRLPPLKYSKVWWEGEVTIPAWAGFSLRYLEDDHLGESLESNGDVLLVFESPGPNAPPTIDQIAAYLEMVEHAEQLRERILRGVFEEYVDWLNSERLTARVLGEPLSDPSQLKRLVVLNMVTVRMSAVGCTPPIDLQFECSWDEEHGFVVTVCDGSVTDIGLG